VSTAHSSKSNAYLIDTPGLAMAWEDLCLHSLERLTTSHIEELDKKHNVLHGKWLIFVDTSKVDSMWEIIAKAVVNEGLAFEAKVSTLHVKPKKAKFPKEEKIPQGQHVILIHGLRTFVIIIRSTRWVFHIQVHPIWIWVE
jgi:hypothetical protein